MNKCYNCGHESDDSVCKQCGTVQRFRYSGLVILAPAIIALLLLTSGCMLRKYGYRQHRNMVAQKVIQYEHCKPYRFGDWKACQHFNERPKSHWPFND